MTKRERNYHENKKYIIRKVQGTYGEYPSTMASEWWMPEDWEKWENQVQEYKSNGLYGKPTPVYTLKIKKIKEFKKNPLPKNNFSNFGIFIPVGQNIFVNYEK